MSAHVMSKNHSSRSGRALFVHQINKNKWFLCRLRTLLPASLSRSDLPLLMLRNSS